MKEITHKQARRYLRLDLDGLLGEAQRRDLDAHLDSCPACRAESESFSTLTSRLRSGFHERWDAHDGPSQHVTANVRSQTRRIIMSNKVNVGLKALGGVAVLVVLGFVVNFVVSQLQERSVAASVTPVPGDFMPVAVPNAEKRLLAFTMERNGETDVYTVRADGTDLTNLTGDSNGSNPYWSPDGRRIAFNRNIGNRSQVFIMDANGSNVVQLTDDGDFNKLVAFEEGRHPDFSAWSPDGSKLVFVKLNFVRANDEDWMKLFILDVETRTQTPLTSEWGAYQSPVWSPDGEHIAFTSYSRFDEQGNPTRRSVHVVDVDGSNPIDLAESLPDNVFTIFHRWSSDGGSVIFSASNQAQDSMRVYEARLDGSLTELSRYVRAGILDWWNGTALAVDLRETAFQWLRPDGTSSSLKVCPPEIYPSKYSSARSKAGGLFLGAQCSPGEWRLYLANEDGTTAQELVNPPLSTGDGVMVDQAWSPDGNYIAFNISSSSGDVEMFILDVAGTLNDPTIEPVWFNVGEIFSSTDSLSWQPVITEDIAEEQASPNKGLIAFVSIVGLGNREIFTMKADGSELTNITNNPATDESPAWSPDGTQIAFVSDRDGGRDIYLMDADGSNVKRLTDSSTFNDYFAWSPDGAKIVYFSSEISLFGDGDLMLMNADGGNKTALTAAPGKFRFLSWSPDGQHIVFQNSDSGQNKDTRLLVANVSDSTVSDGQFFVGDTDRLHRQVYWETPNQFVTINSNFEQTMWGKWNITRFFTDGDNNRYNGSNPILVTSETPIFAVFENSYVTGGEDRSLVWFSYKGAPIPYSPWKTDIACETKLVFDLQKSPDGEHGFVSAECEGGSSSFFLVNSDGSEIKQLGAALEDVTPLPFSVWSPDGKYILLGISNKQKVDYYLLDIEALLRDPSAKPELITTDGLYKFGAAWQPMP